jgi:uncharacterized protein YsxB (DUF464 family)
MIRIKIKGSPDRVEGFMIRGHARYAPGGEDVVCAGVSAIATTALLGLADYVPGYFRYSLLPQGLVYCRLSPVLPADRVSDAQVILQVMVLGLMAIRDIYKGYIDIAYM